jgi:type I restriction enzyme S subunit
VCGDELDPEFLMYALICSRRELRELAAGATHKTIYMPTLEAFHVCAPSTEEQCQIAARLKAQLAEVETARQAARAQVRDAALLRRAVVQAAFDAVLNGYERNICLKDVCAISAGGTPSRGNAVQFDGSIPWVKTLDLNFGIVADTEEKISREAFVAIRGELLPVGTVMVAMYGGAGTIGKTGILGIEACTNQAVCALQPNSEVLSSDFLHEWLRHIRPEWMRYSGGNRKDPNINKSVVENMTLPLPPLNEQRSFTSRLQDQLAEADAIAQAAAAQMAEIERLPPRLLAQAFEV